MPPPGKGPKGKSGKVLALKLPPLDVRVTEICFDSTVPIHYARVPDGKVTHVQAPAGKEGTHVSPVEEFPAAGDPHWKLGAAGVKADFSWPAVYVREGAGGAPSREVEVSFETRGDPAFTGKVLVRAESSQDVGVAEKEVQFNNGKASRVALELTSLPDKVRWLSGIEFTWYYKPASGKAGYRQGSRTQHTLFVIEQEPTAADLGGSHEDKFLFEIVDWSCRWAHGQAGEEKVLEAIWRHFDPVRAKHDTGLIYWRNHDKGIQPAQDLPTAVQSRDDPNPDKRHAASCIVFDRILINCLGIQGIEAAEIALFPDPKKPATFSRGGKTYDCGAWAATTTIGQGNKKAPAGWGSHWIADVLHPGGDWKILDASYGAGPCASSAPGGAMSTVDVSDYEPLAVKSFICTNQGTGGREELPPLPAEDPHLAGYVLWEP